MTRLDPARALRCGVVLLALASPAAALGQAAQEAAPDLATARAACNTGSAQACFDLGRGLEAASLERIGPAWTAVHRACRMGLRAACAHAIRPPEDPPEELERRCRYFGDTSHCLGLALLRARGTPAERATVAELYRLACLRGTGMGCYLHARETEAHAGPERAGEVAIAYRAACAFGVSGACVRLAKLHLRGRRGVWRDLETARWAYRMACDQGDREACAGLGHPALAGPVWSPTEPEEAARGCERGDPQACAAAGTAFLWGEHVPQDRPRAKASFEKACTAGHQEACAELPQFGLECRRTVSLLARACAGGVARACGARAAHGDCTQRSDPLRAVPHLELGCMGLDPLSCAELARRRWEWPRKGDPGRQDRADAFVFAFSACDHGAYSSCAVAGSYLLEGAGGKPEPELTVLSFEKGCDADFPESCFRLGELYRDGALVARDEARARTLFEKACGRTWAEACRALEEMGAASDASPAGAPPAADAPDAAR